MATGDLETKVLTALKADGTLTAQVLASGMFDAQVPANTKLTTPYLIISSDTRNVGPQGTRIGEGLLEIIIFDKANNYSRINSIIEDLIRILHDKHFIITGSYFCFLSHEAVSIMPVDEARQSLISKNCVFSIHESHS